MSQRRAARRPRDWSQFIIFGDAVVKVMTLAAIAIGGGVVPLYYAINNLHGRARVLLIVLSAFVFILIAIYITSREAGRRRSKRLEKMARDGWDIFSEAVNKAEQVQWHYERIRQKWTITSKYGLKYEDERTLGIDSGRLRYFFFEFIADENASPVEDLADSVTSTLQCTGNPGARVDSKVNDARERYKWIYVVFPEGLDAGYPCSVQTKFEWPGLWNTLREEKTDHVAFMAPHETDECEIIVEFPDWVTDQMVGYVAIPESVPMKQENEAGNVEVVWRIQHPEVNKRYVMQFTIHLD